MSDRIRIKGELAERVDSFESLRCMDTVWCVPCAWCKGKHRFTLLHFGEHGTTSEPSWDALPMPRCMRAKRSVVSRRSIASGTIYRVVHEQSDTVSRVREREVAR